MKVKTVGLLATLATLTTSMTVWSITPPGGYGERVQSATAVALTGPEVEVDTWRFEAGTALQVEGRLGHPVLASGQTNETYLYVDVTAPATAQATAPAPANLAIVIDRSGSMSGGRLEKAVEAARGMVRRLRDGDAVSIVTYNTEAETRLASTTIDSQSREPVLRALDGITPLGDTCISCAVEAGMRALRGGREGMVKRMLLLSDGKATAGVRDLAGFERLAAEARDMDCAISSVGIDIGYNERVMSAIAFGSNGRHYFVEQPSSIAPVFDQELASLVKTVATGAEVRVDLAPGVEVLEVYDRAFRREGSTLVVPMGSFASAEDKTLLVRVRLPRGEDGRLPVAKVDVAFDDLVSGERGHCEGALTASVTSDRASVSSLDPIVGGRVGRAETSRSLREANAAFSRGALAEAKQSLASTKSRLQQQKALAAAAPKPRRAKLEADFDRQLAALETAADGFATPPPAAAPGQPAPPPARAGAVQVRRNEAEAADLGF
ncbi:MAG: VWA domain-containing protein [Polyangiaceae bacterium]